MEVKVLIKSETQPQPRTVVVKQDEFGLSFYCDCPAGHKGILCKHKVMLADADESMLFNERKKKSFNIVKEWVNKTEYPDLIKQLKETQSGLDSAREKAKEIKYKIIRGMNEGLR